MAAKTAAEFDVSKSLVTAFETNNRINAYLLDSLPDGSWNAEPPGGKGRSVAAIIGHMHNVRLMWLKAAGYAGQMPAKLEGESFSKPEAAKALADSCRAVQELLAQSLANGGRIKGFKPDVGGFFAYLVAHDAHHRGQVSLLARQVGHPLSKSANFGMWEWGTR